VTGSGDVHHVSLLAQPASDVGGGFPVILDEQYLHTRLHRPAGSIGFGAILILRGCDCPQCLVGSAVVSAPGSVAPNAYFV
jgi:hypothetical protein